MSGPPEGIDAPRVEAWFEANVPEVRPPLAFERIAGGRSNLTYCGPRRRRARASPCAGRRSASVSGPRTTCPASTRRSRRSPTRRVPVPPIVGLCADESVNGAPFYVMEFVEGPIVRSRADAERFDEATRRAIGERVVDTLAEIHAVDPDAVGLGDLGRKEDYVARQLHRWHGQWEKSKTRELPLVDDLHRRLVGPDPRAGTGDDRARRLPARQHDPLARGRGRGGASTGSSARSATRSPTSACCSSTGPSRATS